MILVYPTGDGGAVDSKSIVLFRPRCDVLSPVAAIHRRLTDISRRDIDDAGDISARCNPIQLSEPALQG